MGVRAGAVAAALAEGERHTNEAAEPAAAHESGHSSQQAEEPEPPPPPPPTAEQNAETSDDLDLEKENAGVVLTFYLGSQELFVQGEVDADGNREETVISGVTSGSGACMNNAECSRNRNEGPIPEGTYVLVTNQITEVSGIRSWFRSWSGDWGSFRVPLTPIAGTDVNDRNGKPRDGFKLHGGRNPGSAGCIDVGGGYNGNDVTKKLLKTLRSDTTGRVIVYVLPGKRLQ